MSAKEFVQVSIIYGTFYAIGMVATIFCLVFLDVPKAAKRLFTKAVPS